jgi:hypothetical protein
LSNDDTSDKVKTVLEAIGDLRFRFSEFQESIDRYLAYVEESWSKVKSRLAEFEARLAALEIKLSAVPVSSLTDEDLDFMQKELEEIGRDLSGIRLTFRDAFEEQKQMVN